ncbi:MAG TPA: hypothetical protein VNE61_17290 [Ktedonobacteraceae bacterium]|nr:hypothetical protein [Ktedonobacteraceae bacterium]
MQKKNRKTAPPGFLTAQDAMTAMGVPSTTFYSLVRGGIIPNVKLPGRKENVYPLNSVEAYRRSLREAMSPYQSTQIYYFGIALREDIPDIEMLVASEHGSYELTVPQDVLEAWIRKNPEALHILSKGADVIGYIGMFPLPLETIMKRLTGEYWNRTIPIDDIQPFVPKTPYPLYIAEIATKKDAESSEPRHIENRLIAEITKLLARWAKEGIVFNEIYAVGTSEERIGLYRTLGMQPVDLPEGIRTDRIPFKLDLRQNETSPLL